MTLPRGGALAFLGFAAALAIAAACLWTRPRSPLGADGAVVDFATLVRDPSGGDALICPRSLCARAAPDIEPPVITSPAAAIARAIRRNARARRDVDELAPDRGSYRLRFLQRVSVASPPVVIDILIDPLSSGAATVAMYARSLKRGRDHAEALAVLRGWLAAAADGD